MKNKNIVLVSPINEKTGSFISLLKLRSLLISVGYNVKVACPKGDFFEGDIVIPKFRYNLVNMILYSFILRFNLDKDSLVIYFTIRMMFFKLLHKKSFIYLHEVDLRPKQLQKVCSLIVRFCISNKVYVNSSMSQLYGEGMVLDNIVKREKFPKNIVGKSGVVMLANFNSDKGIYEFSELAKRYRHISFTLITNSVLADENELANYIAKSPANLKVELDQSKIEPTISNALLLLNLSKMEETFGLTLVESLSLGTIPISIENMGSKYILGDDFYFIDVRFNNFIDIYSKFSDLDFYQKVLNEKSEHVFSKFSENNAKIQFNKLTKRL